jgi:hypothetical protein
LTKHVITRTYSRLRGFSTDSKYIRPAEVADIIVNMMRLPDGTFSPRRGYQVIASDKGGLGNSVYEDFNDQVTKKVTIDLDGNLYILQNGSMEISFLGSTPEEYVSYEIYVDDSTVSDTADCDFDPLSVINEEALVNDSINFRMKKLTSHSLAIGTGSASYVGILTGFPITPGSIKFTDGTLTIYDDSNGGFYGNVGVGTNSINYTTGSYSITFSGVTTPVTATYNSTLQVEFDQRMGKGYDTSSPYLISSLITQIAAIPGVTVTTIGSTLQPGAFIDVQQETNIPSGNSVTLTWNYWKSANRTLPSTFAGLAAQINSDNFRIATFAPYEEELYIGTGFDPIMKYDGQTIYKAGMPEGEAPSLSNLGAGNVDIGTHSWYITYEQLDNTGRIVEGVLSLPATLILAGASEIQVTVTNLLQGSGWNTNAAITNGNQVGVNTIQVNLGHTLQDLDFAFFIDSAGNEVTRKILSTTVSSITIEGAPVSIDNGMPISNNLKINIWRTGAGLDIPNLVRTVPNNSYAATSNWIDNIDDAGLGREYITPTRAPNPPPVTGVLLAYNSQIVYTEYSIDNDFVWYSEPGFPEYVPTATNFFILPSVDDGVTGAGISGSTLIITKNRSLYAISGELATDQFIVTPIAPGSNIGCVSHHTICPVGSLLYFTHTNGVYALSEQTLYPTDAFGNPVALSLMIDRVFRETELDSNKRFQFRRAIAISYTKDNQYILFLPSEKLVGARGANDNSQILLYDTQGKNWFIWTRINAAGGFFIVDDDLYFQERRLKSGGSLSVNLCKQHRKYRLIDQVDHITPIRVTWISSWEDTGQPRVRKKFCHAILLFDDISTVYQVNLPKLCFKTYLDWIEDKFDTSTDLMQKINASQWSVSPWNWSPWSGYQDSFIIVNLKKGTVAKAMKIALQMNKLNTTFRLQGFQLDISPDFRRVIAR